MKIDLHIQTYTLYRVIDVTKLKTKILVLCMIINADHAGKSSLSSMICVFEDQSPYRIVEDILLKRFVFSEFKSMVPSVKDDCLYLLNSSDLYKVHEVIRVQIKGNEKNVSETPFSCSFVYKWLILEEGYCSYALFISKDGDLMLVNRSSPIILRIYDPHARRNARRLSIKLHEDILEARKAVEKSNDGNFIILHTMKRQTEEAEDGDRAKETNEDDRSAVWTVSKVQ